MSNGGIIGVRNVPTIAQARGLWRLPEVALARSNNSWPVSAEVDPYFSSVTMLLSGDDYVDYSPLGLTYTNAGSSISTTTKQYGTGSYNFPGSNGNRISVPYNAGHHFGTSDFTIEFWVNPRGGGTIIGSWNAFGQTKLYGWLCQSGGSLGWVFYMNHAGFGVFNDPVVLNFALSSNTWQHVAYTRQDTTHKIYINGSLSDTVTDTSGLPIQPSTGYSYNAAESGVWLGDNEDFPFQPFDGNVDEVRITKGVARYTANFTAPSGPFPRS